MRTYLFLFGLFLSLMISAQPVKVMTYNIRYDNPSDGVNAWPNRVSKVVQLIQKYNPDIIGVQEALLHQLQDLVRQLPDYSIVGVGRDDGKQKGEYSAILYKHGRFGLLTSNTFWLSETPDIIASKSWDAAITRIATWARFYDKDVNTEFLLINTHFDHIGKQARFNSAVLLKSKLIELSQEKPILVLGDFNCTREEAAYHQMVNPEGIALSAAGSESTAGTFCGFEVGSIDCVTIDYIFHSEEWNVSNYHVIADHDGKHYPSDHLPVLACVELPKEK